MKFQVYPSSHEVIDLLKQLIQIPSESYQEERIQEFIKEYLTSSEIENWVDSDGNVFGKIENSKGPILLLHAHVDTVPAGEGWEVSPYDAVIYNNQVYGRGACDVKGGLAAMLAACRYLARHSDKLYGTVLFAAVVREEISPPEQKGTVRAIRNGLHADMAIVAEPTSLQPCIAQIGRTEYEITVIGKSAHANSPGSGKNAVVKMAELITELERRISRPFSPLLNRESTFNVGWIQGGIQSNIVPDRCTILIDRGLIPGQSPEESLQEIRSIVETVMVGSGFQYEVRVPYQGYPTVISEKEPVVQSLLRNVRKHTGKFVSVGGFISHCDADWLITYGGIPSVIFGPGDLSLAHTNCERVDLKEVELAVSILIDTVFDLLKGEW